MPDQEEGTSNADLLEQSRSTLLDTAALQLRLIHELKRSQKAWAAKPGTPVLPRLIESDAGSDLLFDLARLSAESYKSLLQVTSQHFDSIMDQLRGMTGTQTAESATPRILLEISGKPEETKPTKAFCIENPFRTPVEVSFGDPAFCLAADWEKQSKESFHTSVLYRREGVPRGKPLRPGQGVSLRSKEPARPSLVPGDQVKLHATVTLSKNFQRNQQYLGEALVLSQGRVSGLIRFKVTVE